MAKSQEFSSFQPIYLTQQPKQPKIKVVESKAQEQSRYSAILHGMYDAVIIAADDGSILEVNARAEELLGYPKAQFTRMNISAILPSADAGLLQTIRGHINNQRFTLMEGYCQKRNDDLFPAEITVSAEQTDPFSVLCFFIRDITHRKQTENALLTISNAVRNAATGIAITNEQWKILFVNPVFLTLWGYKHESDVIDRDLRSLLSEPNTVEEMIRKMVKSGVRLHEILAHKRDGSTFHLQVSTASNMDSEGNAVGYVFSFVDITEHYQVEEMKRKAIEQRLETEQIKTRMDTINTLSYAINNPLQTLLSQAEIDGRNDYTEPIRRIIGILQELHKEQPLAQIVGPDGISRFDLTPDSKTTACLRNSILIVDDDEIILHLFMRLLSNSFEGLSIDTVSNGREAVSLFSEKHHAVLVMDSMMPEMSGEDAFREISSFCEKNKWTLPHCIFCTGFLAAEPLRNLVGNGNYHALLPKPVGSADFIAMVGRYLQS